MSKILPQIQINAKKTDELIIGYVESNFDIINNDLLSVFKYALEIISIYRERSFITRTAGNYLQLSEETLAPFLISSELIILSAYIKDDIIDGTTTRANKESVHKRYGFENAILLSDILLCLANKLLLESIEKNNLNSDIIRKINNAYIDLCVGQSVRISDINQITPEETERIAFLKAGSIIGTFSCIPGLIVKDESLIQSFYEYGKWLGISLQFKNDFEDFSINDLNSVNRTFQDIIFKQPNILLSYFSKHYSYLSVAERKLFDWYWGNQNITEVLPNDKVCILEIFDKYNVIRDAYHHLGVSCENSMNSIKDIDISTEKTTLLEFIKLVYHLN